MARAAGYAPRFPTGACRWRARRRAVDHGLRERRPVRGRLRRVPLPRVSQCVLLRAHPVQEPRVRPGRAARPGPDPGRRPDGDGRRAAERVCRVLELVRVAAPGGAVLEEINEVARALPEAPRIALARAIKLLSERDWPAPARAPRTIDERPASLAADAEAHTPDEGRLSDMKGSVVRVCALMEVNVHDAPGCCTRPTPLAAWTARTSTRVRRTRSGSSWSSTPSPGRASTRQLLPGHRSVLDHLPLAQRRAQPRSRPPRCRRRHGLPALATGAAQRSVDDARLPRPIRLPPARRPARPGPGGLRSDRSERRGTGAPRSSPPTRSTAPSRGTSAERLRASRCTAPSSTPTGQSLDRSRATENQHRGRSHCVHPRSRPRVHNGRPDRPAARSRMPGGGARTHAREGAHPL